MKVAVSAIAVIAVMGLSATAASAACQVTHGTAAQVLANGAASHNEADCASATDVANQGAAISTLQTDVGTLQGISVTHGADIAALQTGKADVTYVDSQNGAQDIVIGQKADKTYVDDENDAQDTVIATKADKSYVDDENDAQDAVIATKVDKTRLDNFNGTGGSLENWATGVDNTNAAQTALLSQHSGQIAALEGNVSKLFKKNDQAFEGVAMALAMESPQVDPGKRFGISLNWGNFEGENAIAGAAKLRFDDTWAGTAGVGYGLNQNTLGVRAGVQAQW